VIEGDYCDYFTLCGRVLFSCDLITKDCLLNFTLRLDCQLLSVTLWTIDLLCTVKYIGGN
jgi:hypothetical protein